MSKTAKGAKCAACGREFITDRAQKYYSHACYIAARFGGAHGSETYQREYEELAAEYEKLSQQIQAIEEQKKDKADRRRRTEVFLSMLAEQEESLGFDPYTFVALVDKVVVGQDRRSAVFFGNGMKYDCFLTRD